MGKLKTSAKKPTRPQAGKKAEPNLRDLTEWFDRSARVLPWREDPSPYRVWISEIMLQQTQVITVKPYFDRFMDRFPSVEKLARANLDEVYESWAGLGYYSRARNVHQAAKRIVDAGDFPSTRDGWLEIPGVGPYTAGAILSIAYGQPEALVDGNVERVFSRLFRISRSKLGEGATKVALWGHARRMIASAFSKGLRPSDLNQAWMELGATTCAPKNPKCEVCPIARGCGARAKGEVALYPEKKKRAEKVLVKEKRFAWISRGKEDSEILFARIPEGEWRAGLWDLMESAPKRGKRLGSVESKHVVTKHQILRTTEVWEFTRKNAPKTGAQQQWDSMHSPKLPLGSAPKKVLQLIRERFY